MSDVHDYKMNGLKLWDSWNSRKRTRKQLIGDLKLAGRGGRVQVAVWQPRDHHEDIVNGPRKLLAHTRSVIDYKQKSGMAEDRPGAYLHP